MAIQTTNVGDLWDDVAFELAGQTYSQLDGTLQTRIARRLTSVYQETATMHPRFQSVSETTLGLTSGTATYDLPEDFFSMPALPLTFSDSNIFVILYIAESDWRLKVGDAFLTSQSRPRLYRVVKKVPDGEFQIRFEPTPDTSYVVNLTYHAVPEELDSATTATNLTNKFPHWMRDLLVYKTVMRFPDLLTREQIAVFGQLVRKLERLLNGSDWPVAPAIASSDRRRALRTQNAFPLVGPSSLSGDTIP